jgi:hypothetical protein
VIRGGAWYRSGEVFARSAARSAGFAIPMGDAGVGFRVGIVGDLTCVSRAAENKAKAADADN